MTDDLRTYAAELDDLRRRLLEPLGPPLLVLAVLASGCAGTTGSDSAAFIRWVSEEAIGVDVPEPAMPSESLDAFGEAIGAARVVGLGESRHDTREQLLLKGLLVRHLVEDLGFRALVLEESVAHAEALDRYVVSGKGDLRDLMNGLAGWYLWDTEEMLTLVEWVRQVNRGRGPDRAVRIFGMDVTAPAAGVRAVLSYVRAAGSGRPLTATDLGLELQRGDSWPRTWERYAALTAERRRSLAANYDTLVATLESEKEQLVAATSEDEYERMLWLAEVGRIGNALFSSPGREEGGAIREGGMARAVLRLLAREMTGEKAIVWSHNLHVAKSGFRMPEMAEGTLEPMGVRLSEELGHSYVAIGGSFGAGSYSGELPPGERSFPTASEDCLDGALAAVGRPAFLIDLRPAAGEADDWLRQEREMRAQDATAVLVPSTAFDLVYFVAHVSRSQPTPLALRSFGSLAEGN